METAGCRSGIKATNYDRQDRLLVASIKGDFMSCMTVLMRLCMALITARTQHIVIYALVVRAWFECDAEQ